MFIVMKINRNDLLELLNASINIVIDGKDLDISPLFIKAIDDNPNNFKAFLSELNVVKRVLKEEEVRNIVRPR